MTCNDCICAWLNGETGGETARHLAGCQACAGFAAAHDRLLAAPLAAAEPRRDVDTAILAAARRQATTQRPAARPWPLLHRAGWWPRMAAAAAAAGLLAVLALWLVPAAGPAPAAPPATAWSDTSLDDHLELIAEQLSGTQQTANITPDTTSRTETTTGIDRELNDCELNLLLLEEEENPAASTPRSPLSGGRAAGTIA
ncbi:MAG: hypothetical protein WC708_13805 [Lentisphaeria bacterium]